MIKLKKQRVHKAICETCKGNGYIKLVDPEDPKEINVYQCWECDSEGEFYVYEPKGIAGDDADYDGRNTDKFLH
jgi:hypothetical protein